MRCNPFLANLVGTYKNGSTGKQGGGKGLQETGLTTAVRGGLSGLHLTGQLLRLMKEEKTNLKILGGFNEKKNDQ